MSINPDHFNKNTFLTDSAISGANRTSGGNVGAGAADATTSAASMLRTACTRKCFENKLDMTESGNDEERVVFFVEATAPATDIAEARGGSGGGDENI